MKFSKMLKLSRQGKLKGEQFNKRTGKGTPQTKPANYRGGYYASAHGNQHHFFDPRTGLMNMDPSGKLSHNISSKHPANNPNPPKMKAERHKGGKVGNPYHDKDGKFSSK